MSTTKKIQNVKMNLTLPEEFYQVLKENAQNDYVKVATWTKQFLMKNLRGDKLEKKCVTSNEAAMGN
jgi:hypothetical protein